MDLRILQNTPPWDWPENAGKIFKKVLIDKQADESDRLIAADLAGDFVVINDELANVLLGIASSGAEPAKLRAKAAISLGAALEHADTEGFDDPDDVPITEGTFKNIQNSLHKLYLDLSIPMEVRRRILEASVRAPRKWHKDAIRAAYSSGNRDWMLTAVFAMRWVRGFDDQILEAMKVADPEINFEAISAAGDWELDAAWPHVVSLVQDPETPKNVLLAAIEAVGQIRPREAGQILLDLSESNDEEIAEAVDEAMLMSRILSDEEDDEDGEGEWVN